MDHRRVIFTTLATVLASTLPATAHAQDVAREKEKCYGVAKAGTNDCANISESHSCAGQSRVSNGVDEWNYVPKGTCAKLGGLSFDEAKAAVEKKQKG